MSGKLYNRFLSIIFCLILMFMYTSCGKIIDDTVWLDSLHEQGRKIFAETAASEIVMHSQRHTLTEDEIEKVQSGYLIQSINDVSHIRNAGVDLLQIDF